ncbi:unnamed protein product [Chilo suppressalis]|uniref:Uncharacterized protein n=1 Tax=Chilo suppressalis TaxID=168631 RepID=A0ABN8ECK8_CHISP|nr:unnamed protein product [Chilo suppressalis]
MRSESESTKLLKINFTFSLIGIKQVLVMDVVEQGSSGIKIVTREYVFRKAREYCEPDLGKNLELFEFEIINDSSFPIDQKAKFRHTFSCLKSEMKSKWQTAKRTESVFLKKYHDWLQGTLEIPKNTIHREKYHVGRPSKEFKELTDCSKRRKTSHLRNINEAESLIYAGQMALREKGNVDGAYVIKDIMASPTRGHKYREAFKKSTTPELKIKQLSPTEALSMFVEASLTRKQYEIIRTNAKKLYPCYSILQKAKKDCYPNAESYLVTETCAEIKLQALLNHTVQRFVLYLEEVLKTLTEEELVNIELTYKWGCDGSQQAQYKQKFANNSDSDANIFQSSLVPLQLISKSSKKIIWNNPSPSPRYCRPMRIRFIHETKDVTNDEINYHKEQIKQLTGTKITFGSYEITVTHNLLFTMVDGKVCNSATNTTSAMRCYICKATSKDFNKLEKFIESETTELQNLEFGLSVLHARIRFFETLLHISYKLPIKKWQVRTQAEKAIIRVRKTNIQEAFKNELGLIVDVPKANFGNTNDGNTSRRFFNNIEISANITGIDKTLIERFAIILEVISSGYKINIEKFDSYCQDTAKMYVELYSWYPMTTTVHKILIHGPSVIRHAILPIGTLSEEAAEARNKHFRKFREQYSRKFSRTECNMDVLNRLLLTSDPYLTSIRPKVSKKSKPFKPESREMLMPFEVDKDEDDLDEEE